MTTATLSPTPKIDSLTDAGAVPLATRPRLPHAIVWTRDDCQKMEQAGILSRRYELIEGEIVYMTQFLPHRLSLNRVFAWLLLTFGETFVFSQAAIDVRPEDNPTSRPEPDAVVLDVELPVLLQADPKQDPKAANVRLLIEVADTTLTSDLTTKAGLYARAGIPEYWVLNVAERRLHVRRRPVGGRYQDESNYDESDSVACLAAPQSPVLVGSLLP